jgi:MYXO-CTERM domain-containing protein
MRAATLALVVSLVPGGAAHAARTNLVTAVTQEQSQWCWAGVTRSALLYLGVDRRQCELAEWTRQNNTAPDLDFGAQSCCTNPSGRCNGWNYFWGSGGSIEDLVQHFAGATSVRHDFPGGTLTLAQVAATVDAGALFFIRWQRRNGGGHFLVGNGYDGTLLHYMDPWPGEGIKAAEHAWMVSGDSHTWTSSLVVSGQTACAGKADGARCDDGNPCTTADRCQSGACRGATRSCAAVDACHEPGACPSTTTPTEPPRQIPGSCSTSGAAGLAWPLVLAGLFALRRRGR